MSITYELEVQVMASSPEEAQAKADGISQGGNLGEMIDSSERVFKVEKLD
jgi:hypothetical protein